MAVTHQEGIANMDTQYFDFGVASEETRGSLDTNVPDSTPPQTHHFVFIPEE
jgi:hypothetical protein